MSFRNRSKLGAAAGIAAALCLLAACGGAGTTGSASSSAVPSGTSVSIINFTFSPATMHAKVGDKITWTNHDQSTHTSTAVQGEWDTGDIAPGAAATITLTKAGTFQYRCSIHQYITGTLEVTAS